MEEDIVIDSELDGCTRQIGKMRSLIPSDVPCEFIDSEEGCKGETKGRAKIDVIVTIRVEF